MQRTIPQSYEPVRSLGVRVANGIRRHTTAPNSLDLHHHPESRMRALIADLDAKHLVWRDAKHDFADIVRDLRQQETTAYTLLGGTRDVLIHYFGRQHTSAWDVTGFDKGSLEIPQDAESQQTLLLALAHYFHNHTDHENAALGITEDELRETAQELSDGVSAVDAAQGVSVNAKDAREAAVTAVAGEIRGVIGELNGLLPGLDGRWYDFGLWPPDLEGSPGPCEPFTCIAGRDSGTLVCDCDDAALAARYQWQVQIVGTDDDFRLALTTADSDASLTGLPPGAAAKVRVRAANEAGEGPWSHVITVTVP